MSKWSPNIKARHILVIEVEVEENKHNKIIEGEDKLNKKKKI